MSTLNTFTCWTFHTPSPDFSRKRREVVFIC